ncbi:hypothetical protein NS29R_09825 [Enterobacter hormaechei subsp. xiangfangensis]|nr:hypothetical protein ABF82_11560 [Enterobacter hormaechei subsp. steigerwaltii]KTQ60459.1 hypothetical protein NS28R_11120 [Enterobacter hormaechei subsp. xiangfangensis]KTJ15411.1 hypothetical protein ASU89_09015 [Enterobacter hormaechei subsp. steigerwaltii]KTQ67670.1 hypothetical protein NS19R_17745 [Enterobacter hormaechei subsp. xiangfangensis]KTQ91254.1 hypothetical protein NS57R_07205 [Enterobacter hormaechei subsp. xiangfangensis]
MHGIGLCVLINRISLVNCIAASTRLRGTILIIQVLNIAGNVIVKESGMNYWPSASQYMADRSMAETTHHCFIF